VPVAKEIQETLTDLSCEIQTREEVSAGSAEGGAGEDNLWIWQSLCRLEHRHLPKLSPYRQTTKSTLSSSHRFKYSIGIHLYLTGPVTPIRKKRRFNEAWS
jgi:hypothetical protein